jgi:pimeloyl-ACP methyl ester carboxylesterase
MTVTQPSTPADHTPTGHTHADHTPTGHVTTPDGTRLAYRDHHPPPPTYAPRPTLLLLHGLAGHMGEWDDLTERLLADGHRVVTYDARGHGASTRRPPDMTRASSVTDVTAVIELLALAPVTIVGHSLGGHTALLTAAAHPRLIQGLILVEAGPSGPSPHLPTEIGNWLDGWPLPFKSLADAEVFLGHEAWARGLEQRPDGWYARVDRDTMVAAVAELAERAYWDEWEQVRCPTLVLRGTKGSMRASEMTEMETRHRTRDQSGDQSRRPTSSTTAETIQDAGHDVHLDQPERLHAAIRGFLNRHRSS